MKNRIVALTLPLALLVLMTQASCGITDEMLAQAEADNIEMSHHLLDIWVGDTIRLGYELSYVNGEPPADDMNPNTLYWYAQAESLVMMSGQKLIAREEGQTWVYVQCFALGQHISEEVTATSVVDSCLVRVINWEDSLRFTRYPYDMIVCGVLRDHGQAVTDRYELCAMIDGEVRGYAKRQSRGEIDYFMMRIYGDEPAGQEITLRAYDHQAIRCFDLPISYAFDGETHGTLSDPIIINIE